MLDACARPTLGPWRWNTFRVAGTFGYAAGLAVALAIAEPAWPAGLVLAIVPALVLVAGARIAGKLVFYELALASSAATTLAATATGLAWRAALASVVVGTGAFLVFGRLGCFCVGCCHGRPARRGVTYGDPQIQVGLDPGLRGVALVPVQLLDAINAAIATGLALAVPTSHAAAAWFASYGGGRFVLELWRGDPRPRLWGGSEAQWVAAITTALAFALWPSSAIAVEATVELVALAAIAAAWRARWPRRYWLGQPEHLRELRGFIARARYRPGIDRLVTRCGIELSVHAMPDGSLDIVTRQPRRDAEDADLDPIITDVARRWQLLGTVRGELRGVIHLLVR